MSLPVSWVHSVWCTGVRIYIFTLLHVYSPTKAWIYHKNLSNVPSTCLQKLQRVTWPQWMSWAPSANLETQLWKNTWRLMDLRKQTQTAWGHHFFHCCSTLQKKHGSVFLYIFDGSLESNFWSAYLLGTDDTIITYWIKKCISLINIRPKLSCLMFEQPTIRDVLNLGAAAMGSAITRIVFQPPEPTYGRDHNLIWLNTSEHEAPWIFWRQESVLSEGVGCWCVCDESD